MMHLVLFQWAWTEVSSGFLLLALDDRPALQLRNRLAFLDPNHVASRELIVLVVRMVVLGAADRLLVDRMGEAPVDAHHHCLGLLVADDDALESSLRHRLFLLGLALRRALLPGDSLDAGNIAPRLANP